MTTLRLVSKFALLLLLVIHWPALAHDPYEIASTAYLRSNRLDLEVQMELHTAALLAGADPREFGHVPDDELFTQVAPQLETEATVFFQILAGDGELVLTDAAVALAADAHVRFGLTYPLPRDQPLRFNAKGLRRLTGEGPYGTTLTVLDMVNQKVLGQTVLFDESDAAVMDTAKPVRVEMEATAEEPEVIPPRHPPGRTASLAIDAERDTRTNAAGVPIWAVVLMAISGAVVLLVLGRWILKRSCFRQ